MAELRITGIDEQALERCRAEARAEGVSLEAKVRALIEGEASSESGKGTESFAQAVERIRATPAEKRVLDAIPIDIEGIPASELLIRDRRRR